MIRDRLCSEKSYGSYLSCVTRHSYELRITYVPIQLTRNNGFLQKPKAMILVCHIEQSLQHDRHRKEEMNNNSLIRYCRFHYPPSNANSQEAESELHKSDKTVEQSLKIRQWSVREMYVVDTIVWALVTFQSRAFRKRLKFSLRYPWWTLCRFTNTFPLLDFTFRNNKNKRDGIWKKQLSAHT